jgi:hypothetical protein
MSFCRLSTSSSMSFSGVARVSQLHTETVAGA